MPARTSVLYVTDLSYEARGRRYCDEDIELSSRLRTRFDLALCHPKDAAALMDAFDVVVVRNSGPAIHYRDEHVAFRERAVATGARVFTELTGKADQQGKRYLPELYDAGYPVIPTVDGRDGLAALDRLPAVERYVVKPLHGSDSIGLRFVGRAELPEVLDADAAETLLVQPCVDFRYEVSFYFVDRTFQYALYAPDPAQRWRLRPYRPTAADLDFARRFVDWNDVDHGIQRVDACRVGDDLLLVELEDLNPYLSLDVLDAERRDAFVADMAASIEALAASPSYTASALSGRVTVPSSRA